MSPSIAPGMTLDIYLQQKQNKLTNALTIIGVQLLTNTTLKTTSLANTSRSGHSTGVLHHTNNVLSLFESQDGSNIILDFNSNNLNLSNCQQVINNTNKISSDFVNVNGISLTNCFHFINH